MSTTENAAPAGAEADSSVQDLDENATDTQLGEIADQAAYEMAKAEGRIRETESVTTRTPKEWAKELFPSTSSGRIHPQRWKHGAAAALHQWAKHEHHAGAPMKLTRADYDAAIKAAIQPAPVPHQPALTPHHQRSV